MLSRARQPRALLNKTAWRRPGVRLTGMILVCRVRGRAERQLPDAAALLGHQHRRLPALPCTAAQPTPTSDHEVLQGVKRRAGPLTAA